MAIPSPPPSGSRSWAERQLRCSTRRPGCWPIRRPMPRRCPGSWVRWARRWGGSTAPCWDVDTRAGVLRCTATWSAAADVVRGLCRQPAATARSVPERGCPAACGPRGTPAWIPDVLCDPNFPRAPMAARDGLRSAIGFPITVGTTLRGVMEFFSRQTQEPDEALLDLFAAVGRQMGVFMSRKAAQDDLDRFFTLSLDMLCVAQDRRLLHSREPAVVARDRLQRRGAAGAAVPRLRAPRGSAVHGSRRRAAGGGRIRRLVREPLQVQGRPVPAG